MSESTRQEVFALAKMAAEVERDPQDRLNSAKDCLWLIQRANVEPARTLARAMLSRCVDDLRNDRRLAASTFGDFGFWRDFPITDANRLSHPDDLSPEVSYACAQLLFNAARHMEAVPFFDRALAHHATAAAVILACYNLEVLSRQNRSLELADRALHYLNSRFSSVLAGSEYEAEVAHLSGHLLLLKGRFSATETLGFETLGIHQLAKAAKLDPSYSACYASSFAEYGDFLGSIEACLDLIRDRPFNSLLPHDSKLVQLEILFYLSYSLMAAGELERARMCFEVFAEITSRMGLLEARDHARLFLVKLFLKRKSLLEFSQLELEKAYRELRALSFSAALSLPVGEECLRYEQMVKLLVALAASRGRGLLTQGELAGLGRDALDLLHKLSSQRADILAKVRILVGGALSSADPDERLANIIGERVRSIPHIIVEHYKPELPYLWTPQGQYSYFVCRVEGLSIETAATMSANIIPFTDDPEKGGGIPGLEGAIDLLLVGLAVIAIKRFWIADQYVFGLVPCLESPATKFQHPQDDLGLIL